MKSLSFQSGLVFPKFWGFEAIFEVHGQHFHISFYSVCTYYCTQNDQLDLMICSQQKNTPFSAYNPNSYCQIILICLGMWMVMKKRAGYLKIANV